MAILLSSDASIDLYTIDVGSTRTVTAWPGGINLVPANQVDGQVVTYANVLFEDYEFVGPSPDSEFIEYRPFHLSVSGFEISGSNKLPQPKVTFSNMDGAFTDLNSDFDDLVGFKLIRIRTYAKFLKSINGVNQASYNENAHFHPDVWYFNRKMEENNQFCVYELASVFDVEGIRFPKRRMYSNYCPFVYKGPDCQSVSTFATCPKTLAACKQRFPGDIRFGGFPTAN